jgi:hypothetical protein
MDPKLSAALKAALSLWLNGALEQIKSHPVQMAELRKCMTGDGDVRVVYHARANALALEAADYTEGETVVTEIFRENLVPGDIGFALPDTDRKQ